ncbi:MAG: glycoside-pentoside-hexuronide (GPH):cation symporter [Spirochaetaceae bacterium]|jgi:GPH family glycoside/pentoside/hexuronide:cation symporter|nr:glycoside-pentoside-hexuronide (GPH):cation symporter [Spirochaetaceae bacterium]
MTTSQKLSSKQKLGFGIFDLGGNLLFTLLGFYSQIYLTDTVGLLPAFAGAAIMVGALWDAITDPCMGYLSDRTRSRWGRRRPYLLFGAIPMMLALWYFFSNPTWIGRDGPDAVWPLFAWAATALMLVKTMSTIINIPYTSLTPELTTDYNEQTSLNGYRFFCSAFGTLLGAAAVGPIVQAFASPGNPRPSQDPFGYSMMGLIFGLVIVIVTWITFFSVKEKPVDRSTISKKGFFATYLAVFKNRPYVILFITYGLHIMAFTLLQGILSYYVEYILHRPNDTFIVLGLLIIVAIVFIPVSILVAKHIGKKRTYQIFFVILPIACMILFFSGHLLTWPLFLAVVVLAGIGVGFNYVAPFAMVPDTIEYDAIRTGERKEGSYYGMWTFVSKLGAALAGFISGQILNLGGYVAHAEQSASAVMSIRVIIGPIPAIIFIVALILVNFYPLDEKTYNKMIETGKAEKL